MEALERAGLIYKVTRSSGQGIPIGAQAYLSDFKIIFLDVGLSQALLKLDIAPWFLDPLSLFINKRHLVEAFVGQEILAYSDSIRAEIDYLIQLKEHVIPVEVKAGPNKRIKSMHLFFESHSKSPYGVRFWALGQEVTEDICSYPLYAIVKPLLSNNHIREVVKSLSEQ